jgi:hypothetical protein
LTVSGATVQNNLFVNGSTLSAGNVTASFFALNVSGAATISGLLTVSAATVQNNLFVNGSTLSAGNVTASFLGLNVSGAATISGLLTVSAATVQNNLFVNGSTLSAGNVTASFLGLNVSGAATISGLLTVSAATVRNNLFVNGTTLSAGGVTASFSALNVSGATTISGLLTVSTATVQNSLFVNGSTLSAGGVTASFLGLNVSGATTISGLLTVSAATVQNNLFVNGSTLSAGGVTASFSALNVSGAATISGLLTVSAATIQNNLFVNGTTLSAGGVTASFLGLNVSGATTISGLLTVSAATVQNNMTIGGTTLSAGSSTATLSSATINNNLTVSGLINVSNIIGLTSVNGLSVTLSSGNQNIGIGTTLSLGRNIVAIGENAAFNSSGSYTTAIGYQAGISNVFSNCVFLGSNSFTVLRLFATLPNVNPFGPIVYSPVDGNFYAATYGSSKFYRITPAGTVTDLTLSIPLDSPTSMVVGSDGNIYINNQFTGSIFSYVPGTTSYTTFCPNGTLNDPYGITQGPDGKFYIANRLASNIQIVPSTGGSTTTVLGSTYPSKLKGIVYANDGFLYVSGENGNIYKVSPSSGASNVVANIGATARTLIQGVDGSLYYTPQYGGTNTTLGILRISISDYRVSTYVQGTEMWGITQTPGGVFYSKDAATSIFSVGYTSPTSQPNTFMLYSTTTNPTIQADTANNFVGIGKVPGNFALDVSGSIQGLSISLGNSITAGGLATVSSLNVSGAATISGLLTVSAAIVRNNLNVSGLATISSATIQTLLTVPTISGLGSINSLPLLINGGTSVVSIGNATLGGSSNVAIGFQTLSGNTANFVNAIGCTAGSNNRGNNLNAFGSNAGSNNLGTSNIAIGENAGVSVSGSSNVSIGIETLGSTPGNLQIGIGFRAGNSSTISAANSIYIGTKSGLGNSNSNSIFIGNNVGFNATDTYNPGKPNSFVVYSTLSSTPALQSDLSARWLGVGKAPAFALDVSGTMQVSNISAGQLAGVTLSLGTTNPSSGFVLTFSNSAIQWLAGTGGGGGGSAWSTFPATQFVNIAGFNLSGLASFNNVPVVFNPSQIGIATNLSGNTAVTVALGISAGRSELGGIYLGSNPGYTANVSNTFLVYSTSATRPFLQGSIANICLGIGKAPGFTLDVSGTIAGSNLFIPSGSANTLGPITVLSTNFVGIGTANPQQLLDVNGIASIGTITTATSTTSNSIGGITLSNSILNVPTFVVTPTISGLSTVNDTSVNFAKANVAIGKDVGAGSGCNVVIGVSAGFGSATTGPACNVYIGAFAGQNMTGSFNVALGVGALLQGVNRSIANAVCIGQNTGQSMGANTDGIIAIGNGAGQKIDGNNNIFIGKGAGTGIPDRTPVGYTNMVIIGSSAGTGISGGSAVNSMGPGAVAIGTSTLARSNAVSIGTTAKANTSGVAIGTTANASGLITIAIGNNSVARGQTSIAIGNGAGGTSTGINSIFLGSNPGYNPTTDNTFVVYSTLSALPSLQSDLSNRWLGIGCVPTVPLDVAGQIRTTSNIVNTINVTTISSVGTVTLNTANCSTYFNLVFNGGTTVTVNLPGTTPLNGSYWVLKNNSTVNYTLSYNTGVLNFVGGPTTSFLQAGNGVTLIYSGSNSVYYTF